ncbi:hypothetical protein Tco_0660726 [Tanacetum coccineum]
MDLESTQNNALAKLPLLKQGDYDTWRLRIESYIQLQDYALWEIIEDGNSFKPVARTTTNADGTSTSTIPGAVTAEEKIQKKNDLKARSILMMTLPSEHLLTFNQYKDAKTLFEAIEARFGGNEATKKTQKTLLKQMYENFNASSSESLDSIFTRLQKIVSQLAILGENISQEDLNFKFLRSLPSEWSMHVVVWRNKPDLGSISFDDLYNNFKIVEQEVKRSVTSSSNSNSQNVAFVSTPSSTNDVNTSNVLVNTASSSLSTASSTDNTARLSDATIYAFLANQPNGSQVVHEDLEQIHEDDLEEMDLKWQLALLSMKARKFYQRTGKKIIINGSDTAGYDKTKVECFNCHKGWGMELCERVLFLVVMNRAESSDNIRRTVNVKESSSRAMLAIDGSEFDWSYMTEDFEDLKSQYDNLRIELIKSKSDLANYKRGLAFVEEQLVFYKKNEEKESNQIKIDNFENASKSLDKLIGSQIADNNRKGVGYNAVAPLPTGLFASPTIDLSNSGLEEFKQPEFEGYRVKDKKNVSENSSNEIKKTSGALIIKDWVSDCDEDETMEKVSKSVNVQKPKQADQPRKVSQNPRNNSSVLTKSGLVSISTARQSSSRTAAAISTARPIKTVAPKPFVNVAKSRPNAFQKSHSPSRRPFYQQTALKNRNLNNKVNTVKVNSVNTAKRKRLTSAIGEQGIDAVKHALTANPTIYVSLVEQFWQTTTVEIVNDGEQQIIVIVDGHKFAITEASVRRHLQLANVDSLSSLPNTEIFEQLSLMGFLNAHNAVYVAPSLKHKLFSNMKIGFLGVHVPLFDTMLLHDQSGQGEGPTLSVESQHTPTTSSSSTSQPTTSQPISSQATSSQAPSSHEPTTEPITTTSSPHPQETQIPQTTSSMPHDSPLSGSYTPRSVEGSMQLKELTNLYTKLVTRLTSLETKLKKTKEVHGKALTKLVKKGRMEEAEDTDVEKEYAGVEYDFDLTEQQVTPLKAPQVEVQSQETFEAELSVLSAAKILAETSKERVKTYNRRRRSTDSSQVSTAAGLFSTAEDIQDTDEELAKKVQEEEQTKVLEQQEQERANLEAALNLQKQFDQERKAADDIDWSKIVEQAQERQSGSMIRYHSFKKKPVTVAQARKNMMVYLKNMANYKMSYFKGMSYDQIKPILRDKEDMLKAFDREYLDTLWNLFKEKFRSVEPTEDIERALWVKLKRLYEPDKEDALWKGHYIYMFPEKDYPLTTEVMMLMLSRGLQVEEDSEMARDLVKKIFIEANRSRS